MGRRYEGSRLLISDIRDIKKKNLRQLAQSIIIFACFCTLDTTNMSGAVWLISAVATIAAIVTVMAAAGRRRLGGWTNALNIAAAAFC